MTYRYHHEARRDLLEAERYYFDIRESLAADFLSEVEGGIARILDHPGAWPTAEVQVRHYVLRRFPYGIFYMATGDTIFIVAIGHLKRKPGHWRSRIHDV